MAKNYLKEFIDDYPEAGELVDTMATVMEVPREREHVIGPLIIGARERSETICQDYYPGIDPLQLMAKAMLAATYVKFATIRIGAEDITNE